MATLSVYCPHCGSRNELVADNLSPLAAVNCSSCRSFVGRWNDLVDDPVADRLGGDALAHGVQPSS